jgi:hypothetical protein
MSDASAPSGSAFRTAETRPRRRGRDRPEPFGTLRVTLNRASGGLRHMPTRTDATSTARRPTTAADDTTMSDAHTQPTDEPNRDETARDDTAWYDLLGFQRDLLLVAAEVEGEELPKGLTLKERLEARYSGPINHGRLYSNLGDLEDEGLIESEQFDGRTNAYRVTDRARELLAGHRDAIDAALDAGGDDA